MVLQGINNLERSLSNDESDKIKINKVLEAHPEATKHTVPEGYEHQPVDSPLIRQEVSGYFENWIDKRKDHQFPVDVARSNDESKVIFSSSATCATDFNSSKFRETAGVLKKDGSVLPTHLLPHDDESRHLAKLELEKLSPKISYDLPDWEQSVDQQKLKTAYHETCHAVMAINHGLKIRRISIKGTDKYRGVMSTEPPKREITNPQEALREVRIGLSGFIGEVMISGKYTVFRSHPDLTGAIELVEELMAFDEGFKNVVIKLATTNPGTSTEIENPLVRAYIDGKLKWCLDKLTPYKPVIKLIAEELYKKEELAGDEVSALFDSFMQSRQGY